MLEDLIRDATGLGTLEFYRDQDVDLIQATLRVSVWPTEGKEVHITYVRSASTASEALERTLQTYKDMPPDVE